MSPEVAESLSRAVPSFLSDSQAEAIRLEVQRRELILDFWEHQEDMREEQRAYRKERVTSAIIAALISILGIASFLWLAIIAASPAS